MKLLKNDIFFNTVKPYRKRRCESKDSVKEKIAGIANFSKKLFDGVTERQNINGETKTEKDEKWKKKSEI